MNFSELATPHALVHGGWRRDEIETQEVGEVITVTHPGRPSLERFIADAYLRIYGARIDHFAHRLIGLRRPGGPWRAGVGYTLAGREPLFVEQYLDRPVETEMAARLGLSIRREQIVEVGNLAALGAGAVRRLIICMTSILHQLGRTWVVFTSTKSLLNSFGRLDIAPIVLGRADPLRLPDRGKEWGNYYDNSPQVMTANIPLGYVHLLSRIGARAEARDLCGARPSAQPGVNAD